MKRAFHIFVITIMASSILSPELSAGQSLKRIDTRKSNRVLAKRTGSKPVSPGIKLTPSNKMRSTRKLQAVKRQSVPQALVAEPFKQGSVPQAFVAQPIKRGSIRQALIAQPVKSGQRISVKQVVYTDLREAFRNSDSVYHLDLSDQTFSRFPRGGLDFPNLKSLKLSSMGIEEVPDGIAQLENLTSLDLSNNYLTSIPREILELPNLKKLNLENNEIGYIPDEISYLHSLTYLNLRHNKISELPYAVDEMPNLRTLELKGNPVPKWQIQEVARTTRIGIGH